MKFIKAINLLKISIIRVSTGGKVIILRNDQVSGYTISGIFRGFHSGSDNPIALRNAILVNNGNSQSTQVNTLMTSYGWQ